MTEVSEAIGIYKRARELVAETADAGKNQNKLFAFALLLANIEKTRQVANSDGVKFIETTLGLKMPDTMRIPPGELPPNNLIELMLPELTKMCLQDAQFAAAMFSAVRDFSDVGL